MRVEAVRPHTNIPVAGSQAFTNIVRLTLITSSHTESRKRIVLDKAFLQ
jgi:hypothetical protein